MADKKISALTGATTPLAGTEVLPIVQSGATVKVAVSDLTAGRDITATAVQATNSAGLALKNSSGTTQLLLGAAGDNITLSVATNITPANAAVAISPTGTGTVTINPATASTMNNVSVGATTASTGRFTSVTATTGNFVVGTSGQGVDFAATAGTGTSELLADYEEGDWTPTYEASGAAFASITMDVAYAKYTKVGRQVTLVVQMATDAINITGATGIVLVKGLPFACPSGAAICIGYAEQFLVNNPRGGFVTSSQINLYYTPTSVGDYSGFLVSNMQNGTDKNSMFFTATYFV
jgi:hypothetical protein